MKNIEQMSNLKLILMSVLLAMPFFMVGQVNIQGRVTEKGSGEPMPGVAVIILNTDKGVSTDFDGKFQLNDVPVGAVLEFSFLGYEPVKVKVNPNSRTINVQLKEASESLDKVVVVGYGTAKKSDLTGSVNVVSTKKFNKGAINSAQELITGKIAGVTVTPPSGAPGEGGSINIRGLSSLSLTNEPLYVVDGVPLDNQGVGGSRNILDFINPNDIKSITILKDASSTAIYGSRAANGVVLISTKKGAKRKFRFDYDAKTTTYVASRYVDVMTAQEFTQVVNEVGTPEAISRLGDTRTDWQKEIYKNALGYEHNFSGSGMVKNLPMRFSLSYSNQDGILQKDNFERTTASLNLSPSFMKDHLKMDINARGMYLENTFANRGAIGSALSFDPTQPVYDNNSPYAGYFTWIDPNTNRQYNLAPTNPVAMINLQDDFSYVSRYIANAKMDYKLHFFPAITATLNVGIDKSNGNGKNIVSADMPTSDPSWQGVNNKYENERENKLLDAYFTFDKQFNNNSVKFMGGYSYQSFYRYDYFYDDYGRQQGQPDFEQIDKSKEVLLSYFGRMNYSYNDKYLLTATLRADASSKLNPKDRWGYFPSVAVAWNLHNEDFLKDSNIINHLKLRIGYGEVGNVNGLSPYKYLTRYEASTSTAAYQFGTQFYQTYRPEPVNKDLRWEVGQTLNMGLDFGLYNNRINGSINVYNKETKDLIIWALVDPFTNFGNRVEKNVGNMTNQGVELELNGVAIDNDKMKWNINFNIAYNHNEVTYMPFDQEVGGISGGVGNTIQMHREGYAPYSFLVYEQVYDSNGKPLEGVYVDRNGDGVINNDDRYFFHDPMADIQMGLASTFNYGNFDMSISLRSSIGNYMYDNVASARSVPADINTLPFLTNLHTDYFNSGFQTHSETNLLSDYYVNNASFLKIDNISLGYRFPKFYKNANLRLYGSIQNVATFTDYKGLDPEIPGGIDNNFYPRPTVYTVGAHLNF
jgi:iron complex outermembrane receptor protein